MENGVDKVTSWEEELNLKTKCLLSTQQTSEESLDNIRKYLSALKRRLTDIMEYKSQQQKVKATVHLIQTSQYADSELLDMSKVRFKMALMQQTCLISQFEVHWILFFKVHNFKMLNFI